MARVGKHRLIQMGEDVRAGQQYKYCVAKGIRTTTRQKTSGKVFSKVLPFERNGGPLWIRTTDIGLIRNGDYHSKPIARVNPCIYIDAWYNEQRLKSATKSTVDIYRSRIKALLNIQN